MNRTLLRRVVAPLLLAPCAIITPARADVAASDTLSGTVYLPDGTTPAPAAVVDLMLADPAGQPVASSAFARGVADLDGHFSVNPRERDDLIAAARANGGQLPVVVQIGKLAEHGSIDPAALPGTRVPDTALALIQTTLALQTATAADGGSVTTLTFGHNAYLGEVGRVLDPGPTIEVVLDLVHSGAQAAQVAGMFNDPDLVAGWDDLNDPDVVPPLGSTLVTMLPSFDGATIAAGSTFRIDSSLPKSTDGGGGSPPPSECRTDPNTYWWGKDYHNNPQNTVTLVYLDTHSCTGDKDTAKDEAIYDWTGYSGTNDRHWRLYRLKFRSQVDDRDGDGYVIKRPNPATGNYSAGDSGGSINWSVSWAFAPFGASVSSSYTFSQKKIHAWQADGTGKLYHVSWISQDSRGSYGLGRNNGGGFAVQMPEGSNARGGVLNSIQVWMCYLPNPDSYDDVTCDK